MEKKILCTLLMGMQIGVATMENSMEVPWKVKNRTTIWSSNPASGYIFRRKWNQYLRERWSLLWSLQHYSQQPRCGNNLRWMHKKDGCVYKHTDTHTHTHIYIYIYIYNMEYYSAVRKKEILPFAICNNIDEPKGHYITK